MFRFGTHAKVQEHPLDTSVAETWSNAKPSAIFGQQSHARYRFEKATKEQRWLS
jgi:hypothetical protein